MSIDMSEIYQIFFDEAAEHLAAMESLLIDLDPASVDPEDLNAIFRAAHSIKGGAATFGFNDVIEVAHVLESLLDNLRKHEQSLNSEMVDAFLRAGDVIGGLVAVHRGDGSPVDPNDVQQVTEWLVRLTRKPGEPDPAAAPAAAEPELSQVPANFADAPPPAEAAVASAPPAPPPPPSITVEEAVAAGGLKPGSALVFPSDAPAAPARPAVPADMQLVAPGAPSPQALPPGGSIVFAEPSTPAAASADEEGKGFGLFGGAPSAAASIAASIAAARPAAEPAPAATEPASAGGSLAASLAASIAAARATPAAEPAPAEAAAAPAPNPAASIAASMAAARSAAPAKPAAEPPAHGESVARAARMADKAGDKAGATAAAASAESSSIRVSVEKVDQLINLVGELVITQAMLAQTASQVDPVLYEKLISGLSQLDRNTRDLQEAAMSIRMMPISFVFSRFPRVARELAAKLGKEVELKMVGEGTELDKGLIEKITDPLTHLVRNSLDHGIESPEKRIAAGKPARGTITLRAYHQGGSIAIDVEDDGAGLNRDRIIGKARERGMNVSDTMTDQEVWQLIFEAGFSTAEQITDVSGRGVGMDVVKRNIHALGGRIEIHSMAGQGTRIAVRLPLTLAILDGLSVSVGGERFIVPLSYVVESLQPAADDVKTVGGRGRVVRVRGEYLPVVALHETFNIDTEVRHVHEGINLILEAEGRKAAMFVDALEGQHQVVIKSLESNYRRVRGISGATIMGDGKVALILDAVAIVREAQQPVADAA